MSVSSCRPPPGYSQTRSSTISSSSLQNAYVLGDADLWESSTSEHLLEEFPSDRSLRKSVLTEATAVSQSLAPQPSMPPLGKPTVKKILNVSDILATILSLMSLAIAIIAVADEAVSWRLGVGNNQLIIIGFLLSVMNLCLSSVTSTFFLLIEARFGPSTLQNYDGLLRNKPMASRMSIPWRVVLVLFMLLPIGVSVAYKTFRGGQSSKEVKSVEYIPSTAYYGMFAAPGLSDPGQSTGLTQFFNATQPFRSATSLMAGSEPVLPQFPQPYGSNVLLLSGNSTAVLDSLQPEFLVEIQGLLAPGESWFVHAPIIGTVATLNDSKTTDPAGFQSALEVACGNGTDPTWEQSPMNIWGNGALRSSFLLLQQAHTSDQSVHYMALVPGYTGDLDCPQILPYFQLYNVYRQQCEGTWSITRASSQLIDGSCDNTPLPADKQQMITWNTLATREYYTPTLFDFVVPFGPYGTRGNQSIWSASYMATSMAAMIWSRVIVVNTIPLTKNKMMGEYNMSTTVWTTSNSTRLTMEDLHLIYPIDPSDHSILYVRPTLRKSPLLFLVLASQPLLMLLVLGLTITMHSVPLDKGFGLVSILSGISRQTLDGLAGASLSGELIRPIKLTISPTDNGQTGKIEFRAVPITQNLDRNRKLRRNIWYH